MNRDIWVLTDYRTGNSAQALAIAEGLGVNYEVKNLEYNFLSLLPNSMLTLGLFHVKQPVRKILNSAHAPKIIISSGRRCASVARYLKFKYPEVKIIQILKPETNLDIFDLLVLPKHDRIKLPKDFKCKIIRTLGSMNNISERIKDYRQSFSKKYPKMNDFVGVLIGGSGKNYKYSKKDATTFCELLSKLYSKNKLPFFITFSRRTPEFFKDQVRQKFPKPNVIFDPTIDSDPKNNPYIGILKHSRYLIITSDSVSMCSEAASSGKPLYIYRPAGFISRKHNELIDDLTNQNIAKILDENIAKLEEYKYSRLSEADKVIEYVKEHWL